MGKGKKDKTNDKDNADIAFIQSVTKSVMRGLSFPPQYRDEIQDEVQLRVVTALRHEQANGVANISRYYIYSRVSRDIIPWLNRLLFVGDYDTPVYVPAEDSDKPIEQVDRRDEIAYLLEGLSPEQREIVTRRTVQRQGWKAIDKALGISEAKVRALYADAIETIRKRREAQGQ